MLRPCLKEGCFFAACLFAAFCIAIMFALLLLLAACLLSNNNNDSNNSNNNNNNTRIKTKSARQVKHRKHTRKKTSLVWVYFGPPNDAGDVTCKLCKEQYSYTGRATSNLLDHLVRHHTDQDLPNDQVCFFFCVLVAHSYRSALRLAL